MAIGTPVVGSATGTWVNNASPTIVAPTHAAGDLLVVVWFARASCTPTSNPPSGWSSGPGFADANGSIFVYYKFAASSSETMPTITKASITGLTIGAICFAVSGVDTSTPFDVSPGSLSTWTNQQTSSGTISAQTTVTDGALAFYVQGRNNDYTGAAAATTGWTELWDGWSSLGTDGGMSGGYKSIATAGSTGTADVAITGGTSTDDGVGFIFALRPGATAVSLDATATATAAASTGISKSSGLDASATGTASATADINLGGVTHSLEATATATAAATAGISKVSGLAATASATAAGSTSDSKTSTLAASGSATGAGTSAVSKSSGLSATATGTAAGTAGVGKSTGLAATATGTAGASADAVKVSGLDAAGSATADGVAGISFPPISLAADGTATAGAVAGLSKVSGLDAAGTATGGASTGGSKTSTLAGTGAGTASGTAAISLPTSGLVATGVAAAAGTAALKVFRDTDLITVGGGRTVYRSKRRVPFMSKKFVRPIFER